MKLKNKNYNLNFKNYVFFNKSYKNIFTRNIISFPAFVKYILFFRYFFNCIFISIFFFVLFIFFECRVCNQKGLKQIY